MAAGAGAPPATRTRTKPVPCFLSLSRPCFTLSKLHASVVTSSTFVALFPHDPPPPMPPDNQKKDAEWSRIALAQSRFPGPECARGNVANVVARVAAEGGLSKVQVCTYGHSLNPTPLVWQHTEDLIRVVLRVGWRKSRSPCWMFPKMVLSFRSASACATVFLVYTHACLSFKGCGIFGGCILSHRMHVCSIKVCRAV